MTVPRPHTPAPAAGRPDRPAGGPADSAALTGRRRIAFACHADEDTLPGLLTLLRSLALTNPRVCEDFLLLHPGLPGHALDAARRLHPRITDRAVPAGRNLRAEIFRTTGHDTVIALSPHMVVLGDLGELLRARHGVAAVPQLPLPSGPRRVDTGEGLLVIQREHLTEDTPGRLADGTLECVPLPARHDFLVRRLYDGAPVPEDTVILRFDGAAEGAGRDEGYGPAERARARHELSDDDFRTAYCALPGPKHPELLTHLARPLAERGATVDLARTLAVHHTAEGRYAEAVEVLLSVTPKADQPRFHETLGSALLAESRYAEAETHLLLATASPEVAPKAFSRLARLAWLRGDEDAARAHAREGLDCEPVNRTCRDLALLPAEPAPDVPDGEQLAHVALFASGQENAGDKVLPEAVRLCFGPDTGPRRWLSVPVHRHFDEVALERVNARRALVVGGGGLFLPDTWPNGNSAWQWNVRDETLARIEVPLAVLAVGYNVFDGQVYRRARFTGSLRALAEKASFFGLRNHGSVERVRELLPPSLREKVRHQPCPTTVLRLLSPGWRDAAERTDTVLLNCAYDRAGLRFGHDYGHFLAEMAKAVRAIGKRAEVRYAPHAPADERFVYDLRREHGIALPVEPLYDLSNAEVYDRFRRVRLVVGMRGHAGMIPFGCGTPILSLISHPKLAYFLADIGRPEWGVSVHDRELGGRLAERAAALLDDHEAAVADVLGRQRLLWETTRANLAELGGLLDVPVAADAGGGPLPAGERPASVTFGA
ncbi:polysaccharide pyruvyl transferase family protein [Streptomyces sp. TRM 70361]|uniref:polysaccharide pyruvyl transferase family protein n=1 Tax=Streptomyces sp. TRM 70361 TaxID=3116553 RepID=UPI002E7B9C75|nr:polysaccharide pyruvyl transferase family protein [Streptomyces sp. TRM 70361]MEE1938535.1 polysaccharide pyruvyl transferase family protein [Streptomyces sp. TRM 70361]